jgi:HEAT repeat protein
MHVDKIARIIHASPCAPTVRAAAMEALSWMGAAGAGFASSIAMSSSSRGALEQNRAFNAIRDMCWSEDWRVRHTAMQSFVQRPVNSGLVVVKIVPLMIGACFDENDLVRQAASTALEDQVRFLDKDAIEWSSNAGLHMLNNLCEFGSEVLKSKSCAVTARDLQKSFGPVLAAISLASGGDSTPTNVESTSVRKVTYEVQEAAINLLGRLLRATTGHDRHNYISYLTQLGVHHKSSQVRKTSIQWLIDIHPEAACAALSVASLMKKDKKEEVLTVARSFFEVYSDIVDRNSTGAINTDVPQLSTGDEESQYYCSYDESDEETEHVEKQKVADRRGRGARDAKYAEVGRVLLSSSML